jgi:nucleoside-diphosphate-sugar epimerase
VAKAPRSAFVTGGSGFIGGRLLRRLADQGCRVKALARSDRSAAAVEALGAEPVRGELADFEAIGAGAEGCEAAFHLAAHVADWGTREEFERGNVEGTRNVLEACRRAGVRRFVHCGTEAAVLAGQPLINADESVPLQPESPALYSATKAKAEALVRQSSGGGFETVVVRPRFVWGAGDTTLLPEMVAAVKKGRWAWIDGGRHRTSITHVDNVVEGLLAAWERGRAGEAYFLTDGEPVVFRDFISELIRTQGLEPPERNVPGWVAGTIARGGELAWRALPLPGGPPLTRFALWAATQECTIDDSKAREELGYRPIRSREEGLEELRDARVSGAG